MAFFVLAYAIGYGGNIGQNNTLKIAGFIAIAALLANGLLYGRFSKSQKKLESLSIILNDTESLLLHAPANHLIEGNLMPGKLFLTDKRLVFTTFKAGENGQRVYEWDAATLTPQGFYKSIWNAGGEFLLKPEGDIAIMFEVNRLKPWKEALKGG